MKTKDKKREERVNRRSIHEAIHRSPLTLHELLTQLLAPSPWSQTMPQKDRHAFAERQKDCADAALIGWQQGVNATKPVLTVVSTRVWQSLIGAAHAKGYAIGAARRDRVEQLQSKHGGVTPQ